jgi:pimeloyl-ACP methyl ester carboxylesterase
MFARVGGSDLYYEEKGHGVPILLIHPGGATASTWGRVVDELAEIGRVITYDRRGYERSGGEPVRSIAGHTADAAGLLDTLEAPSAVAVGISISATIAIDLALRRPDLVHAAVAHESPWRVTRQPPTIPQLAALSRMGWLAARGRHASAVAAFLRFAYSYRDGGSAWEAFPEAWRNAAAANARAALADFRVAVGGYPSAGELATITRPVRCTYGARSNRPLVRVAHTLASRIPTATVDEIPGAGHAAAFDAPANFRRAITEAIQSTAPPAA